MIIPPANRTTQVKEYYFSKKLAEVRQMQSQGKDVINLAIGSPDLPPAFEVIHKACESIQDPSNHGYQSYSGLPELKTAIADWMLKKYDVAVEGKNDILPLIGSKEGITHISLAFLNEGDEVLVPELCYPAYGAVAEMCGAKVVRFPLVEDKGWEPDWEFLQSYDYSKVKIVWINYPHMPTGTAGSESILTRFVELAKNKKFLLCHDNPYSFILPHSTPQSIFNIPGSYEVALELNSMSKTFNMAGWRIGWIAGRKDCLLQILKVKSNVDSGMFKPLMLAAIEALKLGDKWYNDLNKIYSQRREMAFSILNHLNCHYDEKQQGMFVWAKISEKATSSEELVEDLLQNHHIFITPGFIFGEKGNSYIRISLCNDIQLFERALNRLKS